MKKLIEEVKAKGLKVKGLVKNYLKSRFSAAEEGFPIWKFWDHRSGRGGWVVLIIVSIVIGLFVPAWMSYAIGLLGYIG